MKIKSLYRDYIQKSRLFLYPLLDIKRGVSVKPIQTYMGWQDTYCFTDSKLILQYYLRDDQDYKLFEEVKLLNHPMFHAFFELTDGTGAYIFDFSKKEKLFWNVVTGKYSELDKASKKKILRFFKSSPNHHAYIESYLDPVKYFPIYKELLNVDMSSLKTCGELCDKPDLGLEVLKLGVKIMNLDNNPLNLPDKTNN